MAGVGAGGVIPRNKATGKDGRKGQVGETVFVGGVGEHLGHSERMLIELSNEAPNDPKQKQVDISAEQRRAEDLMQEKRLYRQTALQEGDAGLASVLDEQVHGVLDLPHHHAP